MQILSKKLTNVNVFMWVVRVYKSVFDFFIGFLATSIIFEVLGVRLFYALFPAFLFSLAKIYQEYKASNIVSNLKGKYDGLDERLDTAIEYQGTRNVIVEDLVTDVVKRMDHIESSSFIVTPTISKRVYAVAFLSFLLLTTSVLDLRSFVFDGLNQLLDSTDLRDALESSAGKAGFEFETALGRRWEQSNWSTEKEEEKLGAQSGGERPGVSEGPIPGVGGGTGQESGDDIFGQAQSANILGQDIDFRLHPEYGGEIEIRHTTGRRSTPQFRLDEVESVEECEECAIGPEHEEMVRTYFEKIISDT